MISAHNNAHTRHCFICTGLHYSRMLTDVVGISNTGHHWFDTKMWRNPQEPLPDAYRTEINLRVQTV